MPFSPKPLLLAAALGLAVSAAPAAYAQVTVQEIVVRPPAPLPPGAEVKGETVSFADLDLTNPAGAETLIGRLRAAAERVCAPVPHSLGNLKDVADYNHCTTGAMDRAVGDAMSPMVDQVYERTR